MTKQIDSTFRVSSPPLVSREMREAGALALEECEDAGAYSREEKAEAVYKAMIIAIGHSPKTPVSG